LLHGDDPALQRFVGICCAHQISHAS
jgi:hypothetical protein